MVTEQGWQDFYLDIHKAAETMQDDWEEWHVPSPSGIASCRLRQWFMGQGVPRSDRVPVESIKKMESGRVIEDFWRTVYTRAGFHVVSPTPPLTVGTMKSKGGDGILYVAGNTTLGLPQGAAALLELKDLGAWSYTDFIKHGLQQSSPDYWMQVQVYMHGYGLKYCVFHAGMADASGTKWIWQRIKKEPDPIPPFWLEVIPYDPSVALAAITRAAEVTWARENFPAEGGRIPIELRDFDSPTLVRQHKYPCGWCGWATACVGAELPPNVAIIREGSNG